MERPLTDQEREVFERILAGDGIGLVPVTYDGEETAAIAEFTTDADGNVTHVSPLAVVLTEPMAGLIWPPLGGHAARGGRDAVTWLLIPAQVAAEAGGIWLVLTLMRRHYDKRDRTT